VLSFNDEKSNPVEIEIHNLDEYEVNKDRNFHSLRITIDKEEFTQLAINWRKINGLLKLNSFVSTLFMLLTLYENIISRR